MIKDVFGLIVADEDNQNLRELTLARSAGALPVGGRYRAIDFTLSNMVHSGIRNVGIITQKNYQSLMDHVGSGKEWDLSRKTDGLFILPPFDYAENTGIYKGTNDAIKSNMSYIKRASQQYCLITGVSAIYTATYNQLYRMHMDTKADITMLYNTDKSRFQTNESYKDLRIHTDEDGRVREMEYNFMYSDSDKLSMFVFLMHKSLLEYLIERCIAHGNYDFTTDLLMNNVKNLRIYALEHPGYVGRLNSVNAYYRFNLDLLEKQVQNDLFYTGNPVYTKIKDESPVRYGDSVKVKNSLLADGCIINGEVENSILFRGVRVAKGAKVKGCILMQDCEVGRNCFLENIIADKDCRIRDGSRLVGDANYPNIIRKGAVI
jgi:glucose-1-phosphate adenylyltransferase